MATTQVVVQTFQKEGKRVEIRLCPAAEQLLETAAPGGADAVNRLHSASGRGDDQRALIAWGGSTGIKPAALRRPIRLLIVDLVTPRCLLISLSSSDPCRSSKARRG